MIQLVKDGFSIHLSTEGDFYSTPQEFDTYTPKQIAAWENDEWHYANIIAKVYLHGVELGYASVGGYEMGNIPSTDENDNLLPDQKSWWLDDYYNRGDLGDLIDEAIFDAEAAVEGIIEKYNDIKAKETN